MVMLHWVLALVPLAVFAVVAATVGKEGLGPLQAMLSFVVSVAGGAAPPGDASTSSACAWARGCGRRSS